MLLLFRNGNANNISVKNILPTVNRLLHYSRHLFRAKGRHGTHSPFVYAFVEQVMRSRLRIPPVKDTAPFGVKEVNLLYRTISYLSPQAIYTTPVLLPVLQSLTPSATPGCTVAVLPAFPVTDVLPAERVLIVADMDGIPDEYAAILPETATLSILCYGIHRNKGMQARWQHMAASSGFQVSLDYWYFGLLVKDLSFKAKQHFRLR